MKKIDAFRLLTITVFIVWTHTQTQAQTYWPNVDSDRGVLIRANNDFYGTNENIRFQVRQTHSNDFRVEIGEQQVHFRVPLRLDHEIFTNSSMLTLRSSGGRFRLVDGSNQVVSSFSPNGNHFNTNLGLGIPNTNSPTARLDMVGNIRMRNGQLQSDGSLVLHSGLNAANAAISFRNSEGEMASIEEGNFTANGYISARQGFAASGQVVIQPGLGGTGDDRVSFFNAEQEEKVRIQDGTITTDRVVLNVTTFPDYVFETGYDLKPLQQVDAYIKAHRHLPGMPTESEVTSKGMDLKQVNMLLVEKVEELTLYTIQQETQIEALSKKLNQMAQTLKEMKKQSGKQ